MRRTKYRTYRTRQGAERYAAKLRAQWQGRTFGVLPGNDFKFVVGYLLPCGNWALCS